MTIAPQVTLEAPEDVAANANGMLTATQARALRRHLWRAQWSTILKYSFLCVFALCILAIIGWLWLQIRSRLNAGRDPLSFTRQFAGLSITFPGLRLIFAFFALWFVLLLWQSASALRACARVWREMGPGSIVSAIGCVVPQRRGPVALVGGRALTPWDARALEPVAPGRYRCWLLPRLGWLLSVQRLREWERPTAADEAVAARWGLGALHGFDAAALPENRAGRLTPAQAREIARRERRARPGQLLFGAIWLVIGLWLAFSVWHLVWHGGLAAVRAAGVTDVLWQIGAVALAVAVGCYSLNRAIGGDGYRRDLAEGRVTVLEGPVTKRLETDDNSTSYRYRVSGEEFAVSRAAYDALPEGLVYRLYATPRSKYLVNIEWVEPDAPPRQERDPDWFR